MAMGREEQEFLRISLNNNPFINGVLLENLEIVFGENVIQHNLGRPVKGYIICRDSTAGTFLYEQGQSVGDPTKFIVLSSTENSTLTIWMF